MVQSLGIQKASSGKSKKLKFYGLLSKKNTFLHFFSENIYIDLSNFIFNYLFVDSPNYLCHFESISHFLQHDSSVSF